MNFVWIYIIKLDSSFILVNVFFTSYQRLKFIQTLTQVKYIYA